MESLASISYLRACTEADDPFVYDVFCTTWEHEVAALPNQNLAQHVLRIQHIAQERRFASRHPNLQRYIVVEAGEPAGRLYVHESDSTMQVVDLTLMPRFRDRGIGSRVFRDLFEHAARTEQPISLRVARRNDRATMLFGSLGFQLVSMDDLDYYFESTPVPSETTTEAQPVTTSSHSVP